MTNTDGDKFARALAFKPLVQRAGYAEASAEVSPETLNGVGIAHGGFLFSLSDYASALAANTPERLAISSGALIDYIEPVPAGASIVAVASVDAENAKSGFAFSKSARMSICLKAIFESESSRLKIG